MSAHEKTCNSCLPSAGFYQIAQPHSMGSAFIGPRKNLWVQFVLIQKRQVYTSRLVIAFKFDIDRRKGHLADFSSCVAIKKMLRNHSCDQRNFLLSKTKRCVKASIIHANLICSTKRVDINGLMSDQNFSNSGTPESNAHKYFLFI